MASTLVQTFGLNMEDKYYLNVGFPGPKALRDAANVMKIATDVCLTEEISQDADIMQYGSMGGADCYLRELANFLSTQYDDPVDSDHLILTSGATNGIFTMLTLLFPDEKCPVLIEEVTYHNAIPLIGGDLKFPLIPVSLCNDGVDIEKLEQIILNNIPDKRYSKLHSLKAVMYLVPSFQNPTGTCISEAKRAKICRLANKYGILLICDDVNDLLYHDKEPPKRMYSFDRNGNTISNGSFAKILGPGLRLGWMEVPDWIKRIFNTSGLSISGGSFNHYTSMIVAKALQMGLISQHLLTLRMAYKASFTAVHRILDTYLPIGASYRKGHGGYFVWVQLPKNVLAADLLELCAKKYGVIFTEGSKFAATPATKIKFVSHIRIATSYYEPEILAKGIEKLCAAMRFLSEPNEI